MEPFMIGYTLKYISFDQMILDMPYPSYQIFEYVIMDGDEEVEESGWNGYSN
jgi:hypothetical protein